MMSVANEIATQFWPKLGFQTYLLTSYMDLDPSSGIGKAPMAGD